MEILVLGGTAFLGRSIAREATRRRHEVTCAARGSAPAPPETRFVRVERDEQRGLAAVRGRQWDVVVDVSTQPGQVRRAVRDLHARHRVFVSTGSVYARFDRLEQPETAPLAAALAGDVVDGPATYGAGKVACEEAVRAAGSTSTIVRSGLIAGPGDVSGRGGYYPWRFAHPTGPDVLVPPDLDFPCALIDVDDLAAWVVAAAERHLDGTFNATGPTTPLGEVLTVARRVADGSAVARPVPADILAREGVTPWMGPRSLPLWVPDPDARFVATLDTSAARAAGLHLRPLEDTLARALAYEEQRVAPRGAGLSDEDERALRAALP